MSPDVGDCCYCLNYQNYMFSPLGLFFIFNALSSVGPGCELTWLNWLQPDWFVSKPAAYARLQESFRPRIQEASQVEEWLSQCCFSQWNQTKLWIGFIILPMVFWPMSLLPVWHLCQFARHHDQQAGPAFLPALMAMLSSMTTVTASPQGPSVASEDEDREKWLDDKLRQISSLDYYDFLAFSQFNRRWCCFCSYLENWDDNIELNIILE